MDDISKLRNEVAKRRRAVGSKISRIKRNTGAKVAGTKFDPRPSADAVKSMNSRQLKSQLNKMEKFLDRNVQFVALGRGTPAPRSVWNTYKANEAREKQLAEKHKASIGSLYVESMGSTVQQLIDMRPQDTRAKVEKAVYGPYSGIEREAKEIASLKGLETLIASQRKKFNPRYFNRKLGEGRENLMKALIAIGNHEWLEQVARLSNYQFDALWFGNPVAIEAVFLKYGSMQDNAAKTVEDSPKERWQDKVIENESAEFGDYLGWAENSVPKNKPRNGTGYTAPPPKGGQKKKR